MNKDNDQKFENGDPPEAESNESMPNADATELMLVAYLDGELEESERNEFEAQLASQPELRRRLDQLRQAWDLLDELEASPPSRRFAETTLEMVAIDAEVHLKEEASKRRRAIRRRRNWIGLGLLVALAAGFAVIWFCYPILFPSSDSVLIENLPIIQNLDQYEAAESVEFLEALVKARLYPVKPRKKADPKDGKTPPPRPDEKKPDNKKETDAVPKELTLADAPPVPESARARHRWVSRLESVQRAQLIQNLERFEQLSPTKQQSLIALHHKLAVSKRSKLLTRVMVQYTAWLRRQPSFLRTGLLDLPAPKRIDRLRQLRRNELDRRGLQRWINAKRRELYKRNAQTQPPADVKNEPQERRFPGPQFGPQFGPNGRNPWRWMRKLTDQDYADLKKYLSPQTAKKWDEKSTEDQKRWVLWMLFRMQSEKMLERHGRGKIGSVSGAELAKFFEKLPPKKQSELLAEPSDQLREKLIELYKQSNNRRQHPNGRGKHRGGPGRDRPIRKPSAEKEKKEKGKKDKD
ncbi:MAG: hypothetical protein PVH19_15715 [Planctomycetia bacterium]|jgi:hypothetical protein